MLTVHRGYRSDILGICQVLPPSRFSIPLSSWNPTPAHQGYRGYVQHMLTPHRRYTILLPKMVRGPRESPSKSLVPPILSQSIYVNIFTLNLERKKVKKKINIMNINMSNIYLYIIICIY